MSADRWKLATTLAMVVLAAGCQHVRVDATTRMAPLGPALTKLTATTDASIAYEKRPPGLDEVGLLAFATRRNPKVLQPFTGFAVRLVAEDDHAIVLVCDEQRTRALFEDVGCTMEVDRVAWKETPSPPCAFTLHVKSTCALPAATLRQ